MTQPLRALIVEDAQVDAELLQLNLRRGGFEVSCAVVDTPAEMRAALECQEWDVITSDHSMPQFSAPAALALAKELRPDVPFVIVSGEINLNLAVSLMRDGAQDYIQKQELARLAPAVERVLQDAELRRERQGVNEALRESEERLREVMENSLDAAYKRNLQTNAYDYLSPVFGRITGYTPLEIGTLPIEQVLGLIHPDDLAGIERVLAESSSSDKNSLFQIEYRFKHKNGQYLWLQDRFTVLRDEDGRAQTLIGNVRDITEHRQMEDALRESEERLNRAQHFAHVGSWTWNIKTNHLDWSDEMFHIFGLNKETFSGSLETVIANAIHPEDREKVDQSNLSVSQDKTPLPLEYRVVWPDASIHTVWAEAGELKLDEAGHPALLSGTVQEITERKRVDAEREALLEIMQGSALTKDLQEFLGFVHRAVAKVILAKNLFIVFYNQESGLFEEVYSVDQYDPPAPPSRLEKSITAYVYRTGKPLILDQALFEELAAQGEVELIGTDSASWLGAPLNTFDGTIGVIAVQDYEKAGRYSEGDKNFLAYIGSQVSLAIARKRSEDGLKKSEERIRLIFDTLSEGVALNEIVFDDDGEMIDYKIIDVNSAFYTVADFRNMGDVIGSLATKLYGMDLETIRYFWKNHKKATETVHTEFVSPISKRIFNISTSPFIHNRFVTSFHDITEQKHIQEALRESEVRFRTLIESAPIAISIGRNGTLLYANSAYIRWHGYTSADELIGRPTIERVALKHREASLERSRRRAQGPFMEEEPYELIGLRQDGTGVPMLVAVSEVKLADGPANIAFFQDITKLKLAEEQIHQLNSDLEQRVAERTGQLTAAYQELEAFSYSVSHDLRAPLRSVEGFSNILLEDYAGQLDGQGQKYLSYILDATRRMELLIHDLLELSRVIRADFSSQQVDLSGLAKTVAADLKDQFPQRAVEVSIAENMIVQGDENLLRIVLENLLNNAFKFTSRRDQAVIQFGVLEQDARQVYFVRDNGAGFEMAYANKLFGPFQRLHNEKEFPGTGIGLATVQRIINRHAGQVWAEAAVDQGATIYFTIP